MTTPTDPTTLRTALEALVGLVDCYGLDHYGGDWGCAECHPDSDMLVGGFQCGLHLARAVLATPAPAADEARCVKALPDGLGICDRAESDAIHGYGDGGYQHAYRPAPTPPATGPVSVGTMTDDEGRAFIEAAKAATERCRPDECGATSQFFKPGWHCRLTIGHAPGHDVHTPPATEPVAALVEKLMWTLNALVDETWEQDDVEEVSRYLTAIVAAARAEVDVERYIPGYRVTFAEFDRACQYLRDVGGWSGLVPFDEAIKAMAEPDADDR